MGRRRSRPRARSRGRRALRTILFGLLGVVVLGALSFLVAWAVVDVPDPAKLVTANASVVYYADGKTELGRFSEVNRQSVPLTDVTVDMQHSILAAEDRSFYTNNGISPRGIARAAVVDLKGGSTQGGSTITQQYVKNYFLTADRTWSRKIKEFVISLKIDKQETKSAILQNYLNTIYFGRGAYGVQTASQAYFGTDAKDLSLSQSALLAAVVRSPGLYDPVAQRTNAEARWNYVLDGMVAKGWVTQAERDKAKFPKLAKRPSTNQLGGTKGYLLQTVRAELTAKAGLTDADVDRGGLRVVSTFDKRAQAAAVAAVQDDMPTSGDKGVGVGLVAIKPGNGAVVAMYGGKDYVQQPRNAATQANLQAGSTFKPFALTAALEDGVSLRSRFSGSSPKTFGTYTVHNFDDEQLGTIDLVKATEDSVNTVYAALNQQVGPDKTERAAVDAGYPASTPGLNDKLSNVLGTASPHVVDVANAYATFAALGKRATPYTVASVAGPDGKTTYKADVRTKQAFDQDVVRDVSFALQNVVRSGTGAYAGANLGRPAAGKTGTSSGSVSAWFAGYTPQLSAAVGMYRGGKKGKELSLDGLGGVRNVQGATFSVKLWTDFMKAALEGQDVEQFKTPVYGGVSNVPTRTATSTQTRTVTPTTPATPTTPTTPVTPTQTPTRTQTPTPTRTRPTRTPTPPTTPTIPVPSQSEQPSPGTG